MKNQKLIPILVIVVMLFALVTNFSAGTHGTVQGLGNRGITPASDANSNLRVTEVQLLSIQDGTPGFDADDSPGNDSGPNNGVVRSFDNIIYRISFSLNRDNPALPSALTGNVIIESNLEVVDRNNNPLVNSQDRMYAVWDTAVLDESYVTTSNNERTMIYEMRDADTSAAFTIPLSVRVLAAPNDARVRAVISIRESNNPNAEPVVITTDWTRVSARLALNLELGGAGNAPAVPWLATIDGVQGRIFETHIGFYLHNDKPGATDLRGIQFIQGDITFDLVMSSIVHQVGGGTVPHTGSKLLFDWTYNFGAANREPSVRNDAYTSMA